MTRYFTPRVKKRQQENRATQAITPLSEASSTDHHKWTLNMTLLSCVCAVMLVERARSFALFPSLSHKLFSPASTIVAASAKAAAGVVATSDSAAVSKSDDRAIKSLAGPYVIDCSMQGNAAANYGFSWSLSRLPDRHDDEQPFLAWQALHDNDESVSAEATIQLCIDKDQTLRLEWSGAAAVTEKEQELRFVLEAVAVQWAARTTATMSTSNTWQVARCNGDIISFDADEAIPTSLFEASFASGAEWVEMVDQRGRDLGKVPRPLVHVHNLLHRGIGMFVTKNESLFQKDLSDPNPNLPDLYVHQRTTTKRIFPSLYDMFVGGVSEANESSRVTAQREVAEELGLYESDMRLSKEPLLTCVVCTSYNRCVVDLYEYIMDTTLETVAWQAEEVSWGSFCSYALVEAAADRSIQRLHNQKAWPGGLPIAQSPRRGELSSHVQNGDDTNNDAWTEWDFVPDGLLVWEAWLRWRAEQLN